MRVTSRIVAAVAAVLLSPAGTPAIAAPARTAPATTGTGAVTTGPCPPVPSVSRPPRPAPPRADPAQRAVGGAALATPGLVTPAGSPAPPAVPATSWLVADLDSGAVLGGCGPHEYATPASVQKLLLAATMLPRLDPRQVVTVTAGDLDAEPGSSAVGLVEGGRYPIETIWLGLLLKSGNEAANALARLGGGPDGQAGGIRAMNAEAHRLGALQTHAVTPSGLDGPGQFTSAYDLALIARACFADANFRRYDAAREAVVPAQPALREKAFQIQNDNQLLYRYPGALGGKTGYTDLARHTYVGAAERNGRRLVVTLLGAEVTDRRGWEQGAALLDWGFSLPRAAAVGRLVRPGELASPPPTATGTRPPLAAAGGPARVDPLGHRWARPGPLAGAALLLFGATVVGALAGRRRRRAAAGRRA
ncbi:D-alanyl-D-alanine carboxypeptidase family protein [Micromonospora purpureochromogenes]|uniref:D-alanyl-D-alanine carboxypeptidase (Penicillin-binding protein 5/6) n=1 Tax=Micromonospora purpureochromogenes TaxID=47872 RepID=A0ABX2RTU1_9ACTN|nr:D-alanyl-D-alanine carboxypeptidase [Micromonospora purpureochromogenes]NYF59483.1 D-alanyl-D-alanine carboxypeptidase (penicillin-binding protein 5/6) [Micromonospora purpureochromogenes]